MNTPGNATRRSFRRTAGLLAGVLVWAACGDSGPSRADVVGAMTEPAVPARYADAAILASELGPDIDVWCTTGDPEPAAQAVADVRGAWVELRPFSFGPANERRSMFIVDPQIRQEDVDALADETSADAPDVDAASLRDLAGADQRGLGAIDHLLTAEPTDRRCAYATGSAALVSEELAALAEDWTTYGPGLAADDTVANNALRNIVSESLFAVQMAVDEPDDVLDPHRLAGVEFALLGDGTDDNVGIAPLLSDDLVERLRAELDAQDAAAVQITISTDVVGELGTTVNFSDADGDG